ncbi:LacI family DNA-binding transcriptional regulator [Dyella flagellata]|nr:LacI family DNA-binding transcriptional regulator [Dyella flagellata]
MPAKPTRNRKASAAEHPGRMQMADIARLAGVSTSTVSRALKGSKLVNDETRQRIEQIASQFHYTVNQLAMSLRSGTNRTIAVVVPYEKDRRQNFTDPFLHGMIGALADVLTERDYEMLLVRMEAGQLPSIGSLVDAGRTAGIILIGQWHHHDQLNTIADRHLPLVVWGAQLPQQRYHCVGGQNTVGGRLAGEHLLGQGCRSIAFLGDRDLPEVEQRYRGFTAALRKHGVKHDPALRKDIPFLAPDARRATLEWIDHGVVPDGLFAASDLLAMAAIGALRERGLDVPKDVLVVGYDDVDFAAHFHPSLTTVRQPVQLGAEAMVDTLLDLLGQTPAAHAPELPTQLIVRESSQRA